MLEERLLSCDLQLLQDALSWQREVRLLRLRKSDTLELVLLILHLMEEVLSNLLPALGRHAREHVLLLLERLIAEVDVSVQILLMLSVENLMRRPAHAVVVIVLRRQLDLMS